MTKKRKFKNYREVIINAPFMNISL